MRPRRFLLHVLVLLGIIVVVGGMAGTAGAIPDDRLVAECAVEPPEDFAPPEAGNDTIGWFDGYWYNESLDVEIGDNLSPDQLEHLSARTAARVEALRCLSFDEMPPIEIMDREAFAEEQATFFESIGEPTRRFDNQQFETLLAIGSDADSIEIRQEAREVTSGGIYDFEQDHIIVITDDPDTLTIDEGILAHELVHALQDQHFNLSRYNRETTDRDKAILGVIEGDARRLELAYRDRCEAGDWGDSCLEAAQGAGGPPPNWAQYFISFQPYSDGPTFVERAHERNGTAAVNALFDDMPRATLHTIDPGTYGTVAPELVMVPDMSDDPWERLEIPDGPDYNVIGRAGMSAILMGQSAEADANERILSATEFQNFDETGLNVDPFDPFNYDLDQTDGWRGDRLYVYTNGEDTGSVWRSRWASHEDAAEFLEAYEALARYRGGEPVAGQDHTWRFGAGSDFDMVVTIEINDADLQIVTAPTLEDLPRIHQTVDIELEDDSSPTPPDDSDPGQEDGDTDTNETSGNVSDDAGDDAIPGFGLLVALLALWWVALKERSGRP